MALATKKRLILIKTETAYGTDIVPAATDAILCAGLELSPLEGSEVERGFIRPYYGNSGSIRVESYASVGFETEIAGAGTAGTAPKWGTLLKACNFTENPSAVAVAGTTTVASLLNAQTVTLSVGATDELYTGMTITFSGSVIQYEIIKYVASTKVATLNNGYHRFYHLAECDLCPQQQLGRVSRHLGEHLF